MIRYFAYIGIVTALAAEFGKAMMDGRVTKGEWIDIIFGVADKTTETMIGLDLDPFRPVAQEVKDQLQAGHASILGLVRAVCDSLEAKGIDYRFDLPGSENDARA